MTTEDQRSELIPTIVPGMIIESSEFCIRVDKLVGEGRCCMVYAGHHVRDNSKVALKFYKQGPMFDGAVQREIIFMAELLKAQPHKAKIVNFYGYIPYKGFHCLVVELLDHNVRDFIAKVKRSGLSPWCVQKFSRDILNTLALLQSQHIVHADLKPGNIMFSISEGCFKIFDFGLSFKTTDSDIHLIQTTGYQAPEAKTWNDYKDQLKKSRKRKLQGSFSKGSGCTSSASLNLDSISSDVSKVINPDSSSNSSLATITPAKSTPSGSRSSGIFTCSSSTPAEEDLSSAEAPETKVPVPRCPATASTSAEWRRGGSGPRPPGSSPPQSASTRPPPPTASVDMWSFGCMLFEVFTGSKLFRDTGDKMLQLLKPLQLLEMRIGETQVRYHKADKSEIFDEVKDLIVKCLQDDPKDRPSALGALEHPFLKRSFSPEDVDRQTFPSHVICFPNILDDAAPDDVAGIIADIKEFSSIHGHVSRVERESTSVLVEFLEARHSQKAFKYMQNLVVHGIRTRPNYFPMESWFELL